MKILFFHSDAAEGEELSNVFSAKNAFSFEKCYSGKEFQEKFKAYSPDLVVFDLDNNEELIGKFNEVLKTKFPNIRRFFLSSEEDRETFSALQDSPLQGDAFFKKPLNVEFFYLILSDINQAQENLVRNSPG